MMAVLKSAAVAVACVAAFYQLWLKEYLFDILGVGRAMEPIENFPWTCRRLIHENLEGCEDMWLDSDGRALYAACSGSLARTQWNPSLSKYNVSGRRPGGAKLISIKIDEPTDDGLFRMQNIRTKGYQGAIGDESIDTVGFDVDRSVPGELQFWFTNNRPPVNAQKEFLDASKVGANVTLDVFQHRKGAKHMDHVKTIVHPDIYSPNNVALMGDGSFVLTNDHSGKVGFRKKLDLLIGGGNVVRCDSNENCSPVTGNSLRFPNGLTRDKDGLVYVPHSAAPYIAVYRFTDTNKLEEIDRIRVGMPVDNLSVDSNGDIWATGIPKMLDLIGFCVDPFTNTSPTTIFRIHKTSNGKYEVAKVLEDAEAKFVSGATVTVFDTSIERLFFGGASTPFVTVCGSVNE